MDVKVEAMKVVNLEPRAVSLSEQAFGHGFQTEAWVKQNMGPRHGFRKGSAEQTWLQTRLELGLTGSTLGSLPLQDPDIGDGIMGD